MSARDRNLWAKRLGVVKRERAETILALDGFVNCGCRRKVVKDDGPNPITVEARRLYEEIVAARVPVEELKFDPNWREHQRILLEALDTPKN